MALSYQKIKNKKIKRDSLTYMDPLDAWEWNLSRTLDHRGATCKTLNHTDQVA